MCLTLTCSSSCLQHSRMSSSRTVRSPAPPDGMEQQHQDAQQHATSDSAHLLAHHRDTAHHRQAAAGIIRLSRSSSRQDSPDSQHLLPRNAAAAAGHQQQQQEVAQDCPVLQAAEHAVSMRVLPLLLLLVMVSYSESPDSAG